MALVASVLDNVLTAHMDIYQYLRSYIACATHAVVSGRTVSHRHESVAASEEDERQSVAEARGRGACGLERTDRTRHHLRAVRVLACATPHREECLAGASRTLIAGHAPVTVVAAPAAAAKHSAPHGCTQV